MNFLTVTELTDKFDEWLETDMNKDFKCFATPENFKAWLETIGDEGESYNFWFENDETMEDKNFYGDFWFLIDDKKYYFEFTLTVWNCELEIKTGD